MKRLATFVAALCIAASALAQSIAFTPIGATTNVAVTGTAQSLTITSSAPSGGLVGRTDFGLRQVVLTAIGTQTAFVRCDGVTATTANAMPVMANTAFVLSLDQSVSACSVIASTTGTSIYATSGVGQ